MLKNILLIILGVMIGWITVPMASAGGDNEIKGYANMLRKMISIMEDIRTTSATIALNTEAIKQKLGAK